MKTIASAQHKLHFPKGELSGGELVRPYECPERWDYIVKALSDAGFQCKPLTCCLVRVRSVETLVACRRAATRTFDHSCPRHELERGLFVGRSGSSFSGLPTAVRELPRGPFDE